MNKFPVAVAALTLMAAAMPVSEPVNAAATSVQHCQSADGTTLYTDEPCAIFGAEAIAMPGELLMRIARDEAITRNGISVHDDTADIGNAVPVARRSVASGCARSTAQLSMDLQGAMAMGDANRVAESYHWVDLSNGQGQQTMQRLERLSEQSLIHAHYFNAQIGSGLQFADASQSAPLPGGNAGIVRLTLGEGSAHTVVDFDVERYRDCYFVRF